MTIRVAVDGRYDLGSRFARLHLRTRAERAVYLILVCDRTKAWSPEEIARLKDIEEAETERALLGFASAGIVEVEEGEPVRYRWSADMDYLFGDTGSGFERLDPVCGMRVAAESPYSVKDDEGASVWFCSSLCRSWFIAFPNVFSAASRLSHDATTGTRRDGGGPVPRASVSRVRIGDVPATSWVTGASRGA